jgi:hypothetical protein
MTTTLDAETLTTRKNRWETWENAIKHYEQTGEVETPALLSETLTDIPLRDALLARAGRNTLDGLTLIGILAAMSNADLEHVPTLATLAAIEYASDMPAMARLHAQEAHNLDGTYSLASLLLNGLDMRAPASLLRRSFAHFDPESLLNETA